MSDTPPRAVSIDSREDPLKNEKKKSRRPANTAFRQQRLKAWQPILTPKTVLPLFFVIGVIFAPIGGLLLYASAKVQEITIDYTNCITEAPLTTDAGDMSAIPAKYISTAFKKQSANSENPANAQWSREEDITYNYGRGVDVDDTVQCKIHFTLPEKLNPPVLFYYRLSNFYQNHRRYVASFDANQLKGKAVSASTINDSTCDPLQYDDNNFKPLYPCGLIANSIFNDTFTSPRSLNSGDVYEMKNNTNIAWSSDRDLYGKTEYKYDEIMPPPNWRKLYPDGYSDDFPPPDLSQWEGFMVWMRTAGLPTFTKLYQRNDDDAMEEGTYEIIINDNFPVREFKGTKSIVISTRTVMGGRNPFLGIAYIVVGGLCIILGAVFTVTHLIKPRKLGDHAYLSWNNTTGGAGGPEGAPGTSGGISKPGTSGGASSIGGNGGGAALATGRDYRSGDI